jgi:hypothetical protein
VTCEQVGCRGAASRSGFTTPRLLPSLCLLKQLKRLLKFCCRTSKQNFTRTLCPSTSFMIALAEISQAQDTGSLYRITPWPLVRELTIPTDRPPLVDEILCQLLVDRGVSRGQRGGSPTVVNLSILDRSR